MGVYIYAMAAWVAMMFLAIINAVVREAAYKPVVGELAAHQISTAIFVVIIFGVSFLLLKMAPVSYAGHDTIIIGFAWLAMTLAFEFGFGHFIMGHHWDRLLADYNLLKGRVWVFVPAASAVAPYLVGRFL